MSEETEGRVIDESGDVELLVGPRKCRIRVSSKVLSLSSKVFSIMSSDEFKEGNDLRTNSSITPVELPLPDDDAEAMICLCMALHLRPDDLASKPNGPQILAFAMVADKYDCIKAVKYVSRVWMQDLSVIGDNKVEQYLMMAESAWVLDDPFAFRRSTRGLVLHHNFSAPLPTQSDTRLPEVVLLQLHDQAAGISEFMAKELDWPFLWMTQNAAANVYPALQHGCLEGQVYTAGRHEWMSVMSYSIILAKASLNRVTCNKESVEATKSKIGSCMGPSILIGNPFAGQHVKGCRACIFNKDNHLRNILHVVTQRTIGLCLDCVKSWKTACVQEGPKCRRSK